MVPNNNRGIIRSLARRSMKANRSRNLFAVLAVILTTFMLATVFSTGTSMLQSMNLTTLRMEGTAASAVLPGATQDQIDALHELSYIKSVGQSIFMGSLVNTDTGEVSPNALEYQDETEWEIHTGPAISDIHGTYPRLEREVMLNDNALAQLGISNPKVGMELELTYLPSGSEEPRTESFVLSGWYTDYQVTNDGSGVLVSKALADRYGLTVENNGSASMIVSRMGRSRTIEDDISMQDGQEVLYGYDTSASGFRASLATIAILVIIAGFIVLSGYLLIYNVMYISVTREIQYYGMLKTIGATPRQVRRLVLRQAMMLCMIGIPIGMLLSLATSSILVPKLLGSFGSGFYAPEAFSNQVSYNPIIYVGTILFALATVLISTRKPAKIAGSVSPVDALRYTGTGETKGKDVRNSTGGGKASRMAWHNVFRSRKRAALVFLSLFMGSITFLSVATAVKSIDVENYIKRYVPHDFSLTTISPELFAYDMDFVRRASEISGVERTQYVTYQPVTSAYNEALADLFNSRYGDPDGYQALAEEFKSGETPYEYPLYGIGAEELKAYNRTADNPIDVEAFERGEIALLWLIGSQEDGRDQKVIGTDLSVKTAEGTEAALKLAGTATQKDFHFLRYSGNPALPDGLIVSHALIEKLNAQPVVSELYLDVDSAREETVFAALNDMVSGFQGDIWELGRKVDAASDFNSMMQAIRLAGNAISFVLLAIGILNFINVMMTSVYARRMELAVMESIGMTKRQVRRMLVMEGGCYAGITLALVITAGSAILYGISYLVSVAVDYAEFQYPLAKVGLLGGLLLLICLIVPLIVYRFSASQSITERLRDTQ